MPSFLTENTELLWAAVVSAIVSGAVAYFFRLREARHKLAVEYEYEQRKTLRNLIGRYHGRLLQACNSLNYRFWNLYSQPNPHWLDAGGDYREAGYYFLSSVHRFLNVCSLIRQFEAEAVFVDARIAEKRDFTFLNYLAALQWVMTDVALFQGLPYDSDDQRDHFFSDNFRHYCDACIKDGKFLSFEALRKLIATERTLDPVLEFFDGLRSSEERLRWDRLVAFHLLLMSFINSFGYKTQYSPQSHIEAAQVQLRHPEIATNLLTWLPRHGLGKDKEARKISGALRKRLAGTSQAEAVASIVR